MTAGRVLLLCVAAWVAASGPGASTCRAQQPASNRIVDEALGIAFNAMGGMEKSDGSTYRTTSLSPPGSSSHSALAQIAVSDRLYVDLPGSFGGRVYLDMPSASRVLQYRVLVDSVSAGGCAFRREYWTVYAGMGMWEGVINCYARTWERYCIVSLDQAVPLGKPGEDVNGTPVTGEDVKSRLLSSLRDPSNDLVARFTSLLSSVQIISQ